MTFGSNQVWISQRDLFTPVCFASLNTCFRMASKHVVKESKQGPGHVDRELPPVALLQFLHQHQKFICSKEEGVVTLLVKSPLTTTGPHIRAGETPYALALEYLTSHFSHL